MKRTVLLALACLWLWAMGAFGLCQDDSQQPQTQPEPPAPPVSSQVVGQEQPQAPQTTPAQASEAPAPPKPHRPKPRKQLTLKQKHDDLKGKMAGLAPKGIYILIDTGTNRLYLMRNRCILRAAVCSTGSGRFLPDPPRNRWPTSRPMCVITWRSSRGSFPRNISMTRWVPRSSTRSRACSGRWCGW